MKNLMSLFIFTFILCSCGDPIEDSQNCDLRTIVDDNQYNKANEDYFINDAVLEGDCLNIALSASGCDGTTWGFDLYASSAIAESWPVQRYIRLSITNDELCDAVIEQTISIDLTPLQVDAYDQMNINLSGFDQQIHYTY